MNIEFVYTPNHQFESLKKKKQFQNVFVKKEDKDCKIKSTTSIISTYNTCPFFFKKPLKSLSSFGKGCFFNLQLPAIRE